MTPVTTGVILAAGRGSRLGASTADRPKCMVELHGIPLLEWQLAALDAAGVSRTVVVTGYRSEVIEGRGVETIHNPEWHFGNMVASLSLALEQLPPPLVISYSDIVFQATHIRRLVAAEGELALTYDTDWLDLWQKRFDDPLSDAETFAVDDAGFVRDIGRRTDRYDRIQGQFMGLLRIEESAATWITDLLADEPELRRGLDTTALLQRLIEEGHPVTGVPVRGGWCEVDDPDDLAVAEGLVTDGVLRPPDRSAKPW